jgi:hypothetical protein
MRAPSMGNFSNTGRRLARAGRHEGAPFTLDSAPTAPPSLIEYLINFSF